MNDDLRQYAMSLATQHGVDPSLVDAIGQTESGWKPNAVSSKGAMGPMQLMPATAKSLGVDPSDPFDNVRGGVLYLKQLQDQFGNDPTLIAAGYNAGPTAVRKAGGVPNYPETQQYVQKVTGAMPIDPSKVVPDQPAIDPGQVVLDQPVRATAQVEDPGVAQSALIALGRKFDTYAASLRQATPAPVRDALDSLNAKLGMGDVPSIDPAVQAQNTSIYSGLQSKQILPTLAGELPAMALARTPLGMAGIAAMDYGTPTERAINAGAAFAGGKIGNALGTGIGRVLQPVRGAGQAAVDATTALFDKYGITGLPGQVTQSVPLQWTESVLSKLPGGGRVRDVINAQQQGLNQATMAAMGGTGDAVTPETINAAKASLGRTFQSVPQSTNVAIDPQLRADLAGIQSNYLKNLSPDQRPIVTQYISDILDNGESMAGDAYQKARSRISARANSTSDSELQGALRGIYQSLDSAFNRSAGDDAAAAMQGARQQWRVAKTVEPLATPQGNVSAARLSNAAKTLPGAGGDLAQLGDRIKGLPDSGSAQRLFYQSMLSGGIGAGGSMLNGDDPMAGAKYGASALVAPWLAAQAITRAPVRNYLTRGLLTVTPELERGLQTGLGIPGGLLGLRIAQ